MAKFGREGKKEVPAFTTASMSDIVFMLLFFFMVTTKKYLQQQYGTSPRIQLNDSFRTTDDIRDFIAAERESKSEADRQFMTVSIKADQDVKMGIITDIKQELRKCSALKIMYAARKSTN